MKRLQAGIVLPTAERTRNDREDRVLIVDDSAFIRQLLSGVLSTTTDRVMAVAADLAAEKILHEVPDVILLDVEMPRMDGLTFLHKVMSQHPIPVVICSSLAEEGSETVLRALEYGAVEIIQKPRIGTKQFLEESRIRICDAVKAAAQARVKRIATGITTVTPKLTADAVMPKSTRPSEAMLRTTEKVVVVGITGGDRGTQSAEAMPPTPRHRDRAAHARELHATLPAAQRALPDHGQGGRGQRYRHPGPGAHRRATATCCSNGAGPGIMWK
jgi:CheY-like chemotaxis protein